jgi:hypothetical protein
MPVASISKRGRISCWPLEDQPINPRDGCKAASGYALRSFAVIANKIEKADNLFALKPDSSIYPKSGSYPVVGKPDVGFGGPMMGAMRSLM